MITTEQAAYLAGLFDGEGSFSIQVNIRERKGRSSAHLNPRMSLQLKYGSDVLDELVDAFGGNCYAYPKTGKRMWVLSKREQLIIAANTLRPFLRIKAKIADRFLEALAIMPGARKAHVHGERSWTPDMVAAVAEIAFTLNPGGKPSPKKVIADEYIAELRVKCADET